MRWIERKKTQKRTKPQPTRRSPPTRPAPKQSSRKTTKQEWVTGYVPFHLIPEDEMPELSKEEAEGVKMSRFQIVIRGPDDPVCTAEAKRMKNLPAASGGDTAPHLRMRKWSIDDCRASITELLSDGKPRTFNAICVELYDKTANVAFHEVPEDALWSLVIDSVIEHTTITPFYFRMVQGD